MKNVTFKRTNLAFNNAIHQIWKTKNYSYESIMRPNYGLLYLSTGKITYSFENKVIELKPGDIIYLPKGSNYKVDFNLKSGAVEDFLINFDVVEDIPFADINEPACIYNDHTIALQEYFKNTVNTYNKNNYFLTNSLFYACLNTLQTAIRCNNSNESTYIFEKSASILAENFKISIKKIAKDLNMSHSSFQKKFIQYFNLTPTEYRTKKRMEKAILLLETTDIEIKEISEKLGFYDIAYFYKFFKKHTNTTPKEYRSKRQLNT